MAWLVTPGQIANQAELYYQLSNLTHAGFGVLQAWEQIYQSPPSRSMQKHLEVVLDKLRQGFTVGESLQATGKWLPEFDIGLLQAGEKSGRLDSCFKLLADYYQQQAQLIRTVISQLTYPIFVVLLSVLLAPLPQFVKSGDMGAYLRSTLGVIFPVALAVLASLYAGQSQHGEKWRALVEQILGWIPYFGKARHELALARLANSLEASINAGILIIEAWEMAAAACGSPKLHKAVAAWKPDLLGGQTPAEKLRQTGVFPSVFTSLYATGEMAGKLDETLRRIFQYYQEGSMRKLSSFAQWLPRLIYFGIVLMIAYQVLTFWTGYYGNMLKEF
jgi:type II secretory pathway component PulF